MHLDRLIGAESHVDQSLAAQRDKTYTMGFAVNTKLLPMKAHYFFFHCATGSIVPFLSTYARQLGFTTVAVGMITTVMAVSALILRPLSGFVADKFRVRKALLVGMLVVTAGALMGISSVRPKASAVPFERRCNTLQYCPNVEPPGDCLLEQLLNQRADGRMQCMLQCTSTDDPAVEYEITLEIGLAGIQLVDGCQQFPIHNQAAQSNTSCPTQHCRGLCTNPNVMHLLSSNRAENRITIGANMSPQLWFFVVCMALYSALYAAGICLSNSWCCALLEDKTHLYGKQRMWGSLGWGLISLLSGLLVDSMSRGQALKDYSGVFYLMLAFMVCDLFAATSIRNVQSTGCPAMMASIGRLFVRPHILVFVAWCIVVGMFTSVTRLFLFWHLEELAEATVAADWAGNATRTDHSKTLQGLVTGVQTFGGEIPMFYLAGCLLQRIGHVHAMSLVLGSFAVRFLLYSVLSDPWWTLPVELLQGLTKGVFTSTMTSYASRLAPTGAGTVMQAMSGAMYEGVGFALGGLIGGWSMERLGGSATFLWFGCGALVLCGMHVIVQVAFAKGSADGGELANGEDVNAEVKEVILCGDLAEQGSALSAKCKVLSDQ